MYRRDTELRKVKLRDLEPVYWALDCLGLWKEFIGRIPLDLESETFIQKYTWENLETIEKDGKYPESPTKILFKEWSTSGSKRPTLETPLNLLINNEMFRAADMVAVNLLGGN